MKIFYLFFFSFLILMNPKFLNSLNLQKINKSKTLSQYHYAARNENFDQYLNFNKISNSVIEFEINIICMNKIENKRLTGIAEKLEAKELKEIPDECGIGYIAYEYVYYSMGRKISIFISKLFDRARVIDEPIIKLPFSNVLNFSSINTLRRQAI